MNWQSENTNGNSLCPLLERHAKLEYLLTMQQVKPEQRSHWGLIVIVGILAIIMFILVAIIVILFIANQMGSSRTDRFNPFLGKNLLHCTN